MACTFHPYKSTLIGVVSVNVFKELGSNASAAKNDVRRGSSRVKSMRCIIGHHSRLLGYTVFPCMDPSTFPLPSDHHERWITCYLHRRLSPHVHTRQEFHRAFRARDTSTYAWTVLSMLVVGFTWTLRLAFEPWTERGSSAGTNRSRPRSGMSLPRKNAIGSRYRRGDRESRLRSSLSFSGPSDISRSDPRVPVENVGVFQTLLRETFRVGGSGASTVAPYLNLWCSVLLVTSDECTSKHVHVADSDPFAHTERRSVARETVQNRLASTHGRRGTKGNHPEGERWQRVRDS